MTPNVLTDSATEPLEAGKGGEGGVFQISNADFVAAVFPVLPEGGFPAACAKSGDREVQPSSQTGIRSVTSPKSRNGM